MGSDVPQSHTTTQQWQSFELRMRRRRVQRCVLRASEALTAGRLADAREALEEAQHLEPDSADVSTLAARLAVVRSVPARQSARWYAPAAAALVFSAAGLGWLWIGVPPPPAPSPDTVVARHTPPAPMPNVAPAVGVPDGDATTGAVPPVDEVASDATEFAAVPDAAPAPVSDPAPADDRPASAQSIPPVDTAPTDVRPASASSAPPVPRTSSAQPEGPPAAATALDAAGTAGVRRAEVAPATAPATMGRITGNVAPAVEAGSTPRPAPERIESPALVPDVSPLALDLSSTPVAPDPPRAPPAAAAREAAPPAVLDERQVRAALNRYQAAYSDLDASAAGAVWPSVNRRALARAFDGLASQSVSLGQCNVRVSGAAATAECSGQARWTPKVGGGTQIAARHWRFELAQKGDQWIITEAMVR
jgi:hypothetical protein